MIGVTGPYFDGKRLRWCDDLAAFRTLEAELGSPYQTLAQIAEAPPDVALQAEAALIAASRKAFGLEPLNVETGVGVSDLVAKQMATDLVQRSIG